MAEGIEQNILLRADGGSAAAAEIAKTSNALNRTAESSSNLQEKFQHRFQHIGLNLFAGDALRAAGLGRETRAVVQTLNMALMAGEGAFGIATGGATLFIAGLVALIGMIDKVAEHTKTQVQELEKLNESHHKELKETQDVISSINDYVGAVGNVPAALKAWETSEKNLEKAQVERQVIGDREQLKALTLLMNQERERAGQLKEQISDQEKVGAQLKSSAVDASVLAAQAGSLKKLRDEFDQQSMAVLKSKAGIDQLIATLKLLETKGTDDIKGLTKAAEEANKQKAKSDHEAYLEWKKNIDTMEKENDKALKHATAENEKEMKKQGEMVRNVANQIGNDIGGAFAKSIVEGKSFTDQMHQMFTNMAEHMIEDIIKVMVKLAALWVLEQATGTQGLARTFGFAGNFATGGQVMVDRPTLFMAGEAGPEMATFTPMASMGSGDSGQGGGGGVTIGSIQVQTVIHGVTNPDQIAQQVGQKIVEQIRGAGQLSFVRA